jgi:tRNA modification GTPase
MNPATTIFALASAPGRAGVAVFRISGPQTAKAFALCGEGGLPEPRRAMLRKIRHPQDGGVIDEALVLWFPAPHSFTGEDVAEFHTHGGRAIANAVTECLRTLGFRLAEPGEFTRRAFENGRLDLTEAEAVADLVAAETEAQRRQAWRQFEGALGGLYEQWRSRLMRALAHLEAAIDFSDEDVPADLADKQASTLRALADEITRHLDDKNRGERLREGFSVAILGPPNAGKSSLLNALAKRDAAIVSSIAGTTRDIIEVHLDLGGWPLILADTAGLRENAGEIESEGIRRALARAEHADIKLLVFDGAVWPALDAATQKLVDEQTIMVMNKADVIGDRHSAFRIRDSGSFQPRIPNPESQILFLSAQTGEGIPELLAQLTKRIEKQFDVSAPPLTRARHREALEESRDCLMRALAANEAELRAEDVRLAMRALGRITGRVDVEDLLDVIFRDFCIGK